MTRGRVCAVAVGVGIVAVLSAVGVAVGCGTEEQPTIISCDEVMYKGALITFSNTCQNDEMNTGGEIYSEGVSDDFSVSFCFEMTCSDYCIATVKSTRCATHVGQVTGDPSPLPTAP